MHASGSMAPRHSSSPWLKEWLWVSCGLEGLKAKLPFLLSQGSFAATFVAFQGELELGVYLADLRLP